MHNMVFQFKRLFNLKFNELTTSEKIFYKLKIMQNAVSLTKTSKNYKINSKALSQQLFFFFFKLICTTKRTAQNYYHYRQSFLQIYQTILKKFLLNQEQLFFQIGNIESQSRYQKYKLFKTQFLTLSPKFFTEFAKNQLSTTNAVNLTPNNFNKTLQKSLLKLIEIFLNKFKYDILGIKIICVGK